MNTLRLIALSVAVVMAAPAAAQQAPLGESAKALIGSWEFSNADRDKTCTVTFKADPGSVGYKVEFEAKCGDLFPLVKNVVGWRLPEGDLLVLLDAQGRSLVEFSEVETGIYEAPTPGVGVLFLQNAASAGPPPKGPEQLTGDWVVARGRATVCNVTLAMSPAGDGFAMTLKPGCDAAITRNGFTQWNVDRGELVLTPARGNPWRFEEGENGVWRRVPEGVDQLTMTKQ
jgi:hypothetical protein